MIWTRNLYLPRHPRGLSMGTQRHKREPTTIDYYRIRTRKQDDDSVRRRFRGGAHPTVPKPPHGRRPAAVVVPFRLRPLTSTTISSPIHQPPTPSLMHADSITCMCPGTVLITGEDLPPGRVEAPEAGAVFKQFTASVSEVSGIFL